MAVRAKVRVTARVKVRVKAEAGLRESHDRFGYGRPARIHVSIGRGLLAESGAGGASWGASSGRVRGE